MSDTPLAKATMNEIQRELLLRAIGRTQVKYNLQRKAVEDLGRKLGRQQEELARITGQRIQPHMSRPAPKQIGDAHAGGIIQSVSHIGHTAYLVGGEWYDDAGNRLHQTA